MRLERKKERKKKMNMRLGNDLAIVAAVSKNGVIGNKGGLPWGTSYRDDLRHFRKLTMGQPIIMGRKTWESLPRKPLQGRLNIVISHQVFYEPSGNPQFVYNLKSALDIATRSSLMPFVIGGASLYKQAMPLASHLYITRIDKEFEGDTYFPAFDQHLWAETGMEVMGDLAFMVYQNRLHNLEAHVKEKTLAFVERDGLTWLEGWQRVMSFKAMKPRLWWALLQQNEPVRNDLLISIMCKNLITENDERFLWKWADFTESFQAHQ